MKGAVRRPAALAAALALSAALPGCALPIQSDIDEASGLVRYAARFDHAVDRQTNLLDRALAECGEKTVKAETACVRQAVDGAHLSAGALMALVPGCRAGAVCHYDHTTRDKLGFIEASATDFVRRWRIDLDVRRPAAQGAQVPITVVDRDDFDAKPLAAK